MPEAAWLTLGKASEMLGVDPDTLRRWADGGRVAVLRTPGGHRRFPRSEIEAMLPRSRRSAGLGEPLDRIAAEFRRRVRSDLASESEQDWRAHLDERTLEWFRERGRRMSQLLLSYLDSRTSGARGPLMAQAAALGREYGAESARREMSLGQATQAFLFFRARFMAEIAHLARKRSPAPEADLLFEQADRALDRVLIALIEGHQRIA